MTVPPVPGWTPALLVAVVGACTLVGEPGARQAATGLQSSAGRERPESGREWLLAIAGVAMVGGLLARASLHSVLVLALTTSEPSRVATTPRRGLQTPAEISERDQAGIQLVSGLVAAAFIALLPTIGLALAVPAAAPLVAASALPLLADIPLGLHQLATTTMEDNS